MQPSLLARFRNRPSFTLHSSSGWESVIESEPLEFQLPTVHLDYDWATCDALVSEHILGAKVIGLDIEWRPTGSLFNGSGKPALLQLSTPKNVVLVPLAHLSKPLQSVERLLSDDSCFAVGSGVLEDVRKLGEGGEDQLGINSFDFTVAGAKANVFEVGKGLSGCVSLLGGPTLAKPKKVQMSNWEARNLSPAQIEYAALDAYASGWGTAGVFKAIRKQGGPEVSFIGWLTEQASIQAKESLERQALQKSLMRSAGEVLTGGAWLELSVFSDYLKEHCREELALSPKDSKLILLNFLSKLQKKGLVQVEMAAVMGDRPEAKKIRRSPGKRW